MSNRESLPLIRLALLGDPYRRPTLLPVPEVYTVYRPSIICPLVQYARAAEEGGSVCTPSANKSVYNAALSKVYKILHSLILPRRMGYFP